jgi:hypothetical protein
LRQALPALAVLGLTATSAGAVVMGNSSALSQYTVRVIGRDHCSGVAIARRAIATAAHCASRRARVMAGGGGIAVVAVTHSTTLDDGRRVQVSGDAAIMQLAEPLPSSVAPAPVGAGQGNLYTIAGFGTVNESQRGAFGSLNAAQLVSAGARVLVDPNRSGSNGASACFGDSGGPVMRGGMLVGVITRASRPGSRLACGHLTRWAPVVASGTPVERANRFTTGSAQASAHASVRRTSGRQLRGRNESAQASRGLDPGYPPIRSE